MLLWKLLDLFRYSSELFTIAVARSSADYEVPKILDASEQRSLHLPKSGLPGRKAPGDS